MSITVVKMCLSMWTSVDKSWDMSAVTACVNLIADTCQPVLNCWYMSIMWTHASQRWQLVNQRCHDCDSQCRHVAVDCWHNYVRAAVSVCTCHFILTFSSKEVLALGTCELLPGVRSVIDDVRQSVLAGVSQKWCTIVSISKKRHAMFGEGKWCFVPLDSNLDNAYWDWKK